jgi:subtilisin family serine protease
MRLTALFLFVAASSAFAQFPIPSDEVIVEFRDAEVSAAAVRATAKRFRADLAAVSADAEVRWEYLRVFRGVSATIPRAAIPAVERLPYVKKVHEDREMHAMAGAAVDQIRATQVWTSLGTRGKGIVVSIIDTGIDYNHEALGKGFGPGFKVIGGYDFANKDGDPLDDNGHGTHVAGIVAGNSASHAGVAPEASLMAFKVLRSTGIGRESDVIAAIEVSVDPNGDNDTSDHVDVINLSLGSRLCEGSPDDASALAVDNAVRIGVVVAVAAGNESGKYHCISSPGLSRTAITVGAVDSSDRVAGFSSRGPAQKDLAMKPDVGAPGVGIQSSLPNNRYGPASGTSMAAPHVAGAAALLKALHRDWTPAQIKKALMIHAAPTNQEAMAIGSGRIDVYRAATGALTVDKPSLDFGLDSAQEGNWKQSRKVSVTNRGEQTATWSVKSSPMSGVAIAVSPSTLTLAPGASGEVTLSIDVDNTAVTVPKSLSAGGVITLSSGAENVYVPWTFVKAVRATVSWEKDAASVVVFDAAHTAQFDPAPLDARVAELLLAQPGSYDIFVFGSTLKNGAFTRASFIYLEAAHLGGDMTIATTEAQAGNVIRGATPGADGKPLVSAADQTYALSGRLVWPNSSSEFFKSMVIPPLPLHELHVNNIRDVHALQIGETFIDFFGNAVYAIQHPAFKGVSAGVTLAAPVLKSADLQLLVPPGATNPRIVTQVLPASVSVNRPYRETVWNARIYLTPDADISFTVAADGTGTLYQTPVLRVADGRVTASAASVPWWYHGNRFVFGGAPYFAAATFSNATSLLRPTLTVNLFGTLGESRPADRLRTSIATYGDDGQLRATVANWFAGMDFSAAGPYTVEVTNDATQWPDLPVQTKLTMTLDSSRADYMPPAVTTLFILDAAAQAVRTVAPRGSAALYFSSPEVRGEATKVSYRYAGATSWTPLAVTQAGEDPKTGILFRADLTPAANVSWGRVELKIDLADAAGNTTSMVMLPAFSVGGEYPARRRASH